MKWIVFKKHPEERVHYIIPGVTTIQSLSYQRFYKWITSNFEIKDLEKFIELLNSHILLKLQDSELTIMKEMNIKSHPHEDELKKMLNPNYTNETKKDSTIKTIQKEIMKHKNPTEVDKFKWK